VNRSLSKIKNEFFVCATITVIAFLLIGGKPFFNSATGQTSPCDNGTIIPSSNNVLPVILIHGYNEDSGIWSQWAKLLEHDRIPFCIVSFHQSDDECGNAIDHANELAQIVQEVKSMTGQNQVNIVGHSKGGLDARVYLAQSGTHDVANLIMIGTPNGGDPLANEAASYSPFLNFLNFYCTPALYDIEIGADDTNAQQNQNTNYYTIYGDWNPSLPCPLLAFENDGYTQLESMNAGNNDGIVPVSSVESLSNFTNLGHTDHCHTGLLANEEYDMTKSVLMP
jgi:pimeloyl-ACP methyl ester carboxylesterase